MFTISKTLQLAQLNLHTWLLAYLQECAMSGGQPPDNIDKFLPWNMTEKQKKLFAGPPVSEKYCNYSGCFANHVKLFNGLTEYLLVDALTH